MPPPAGTRSPEAHTSRRGRRNSSKSKISSMVSSGRSTGRALMAGAEGLKTPRMPCPAWSRPCTPPSSSETRSHSFMRNTWACSLSPWGGGGGSIRPAVFKQVPFESRRQCDRPRTPGPWSGSPGLLPRGLPPTNDAQQHGRCLCLSHSAS